MNRSSPWSDAAAIRVFLSWSPRVLLSCAVLIVLFIWNRPHDARGAPFQRCGSYSVLVWEDLLCCGAFD